MITRSLIILFFISSFFSCHSPKIDKAKVEDILKTLKDGQAKIIVKIDGEDFYVDESVFIGEISVYQNSFRMNVTDQFESNVILSFSQNNWNVAQKPIKQKVTVENQVNASVMVGKVKDKIKRLGEGYLLAEGEMTLETLTKERCILRFGGTITKFENMNNKSKWQKAEGIVIYKTPKIILQNLKESEVYF